MSAMATRRRFVHDEPPLDFRDIARSQWDTYVESRVDHQHVPRVTSTRRRAKRREAPSQRQEDALLLFLRHHGY